MCCNYEEEGEKGEQRNTYMGDGGREKQIKP